MVMEYDVGPKSPLWLVWEMLTEIAYEYLIYLYLFVHVGGTSQNKSSTQSG